jgi:hypothetical protein
VCRGGKRREQRVPPTSFLVSVGVGSSTEGLGAPLCFLVDARGRRRRGRPLDGRNFITTPLNSPQRASRPRCFQVRGEPLFPFIVRLFTTYYRILFEVRVCVANFGQCRPWRRRRHSGAVVRLTLGGWRVRRSAAAH